MADRVVAVVLRPDSALAVELAEAMAEDVVDLVTDTPLVRLAILTAGDVAATSGRWPGTAVLPVPLDAPAGLLLARLAAAEPAAAAVAVVAADVPDLPGLLLGKLFSAVAGERAAAAAVCPAEAGGLVAVAVRLPVPTWLADADVRLDDAAAVHRLREVAPPGGLAVGPGWHRVRAAADVSRLDPGLEGWAATRRALGR